MFHRKTQWKATNKKTKTQMEGYYLNKAQEECEGMDWIHQALINMVMNLRIPQNDENFLGGWEAVSFSGWLSSKEFIG
jgi:hypothetical protein